MDSKILIISLGLIFVVGSYVMSMSILIISKIKEDVLAESV